MHRCSLLLYRIPPFVFTLVLCSLRMWTRFSRLRSVVGVNGYILWPFSSWPFCHAGAVRILEFELLTLPTLD
ncbi:hypothetical protein V8F33_003767 [Rhypophila sp. PSN 637]